MRCGRWQANVVTYAYHGGMRALGRAHGMGSVDGHRLVEL